MKRLGLTSEGHELTGRGIRIAADLDEEMFGPDDDPLRGTLQNIAARPGPLPDPHGTRARNGGNSTCPQRDSNPCRRLERAVS